MSAKSELCEIKRKMILIEAAKWIGVHEGKHNNTGPEVEMFQKAVDNKAQGEPWCAAFVMYCIKSVDQQVDDYAQADLPKTWLFKSEHCATIWAKSPKDARLLEPKPGCLVVWGYELNGKPTGSGHIGIVEAVGDTFITTIEGNTGPDKNTIQREGDGVYRKTRPLYHGVGNLKLIGYLLPWSNLDIGLNLH